MKVVRIDWFDEIDRAAYTPVDKIEMIMLNADGTDRIKANGQTYDCFNGMFAIYNMDEFEGGGC